MHVRHAWHWDDCVQRAETAQDLVLNLETFTTRVGEQTRHLSRSSARTNERTIAMTNDTEAAAILHAAR